MIDTWFFTALVMGVLALGVLLRGVPAKSMDDRLVAGTMAVILVSMAALLLSIALGMIVILDLAIVLSILCFGLMITTARNPGAGSS